MKETAKLQAEIEQLAMMRTYWRDMRNFLCATQSKDMAKTLKQRFQNLKDSYIDKYDQVDPENAIEIAKYKEARSVLGMIITEMNESLCQANLGRIDSEIKSKQEELEKVIASGKGADENVYDTVQKLMNS